MGEIEIRSGMSEARRASADPERGAGILLDLIAALAETRKGTEGFWVAHTQIGAFDLLGSKRGWRLRASIIESATRQSELETWITKAGLDAAVFPTRRELVEVLGYAIGKFPLEESE